MYRNKRIFITGGTGTFGNFFVDYLIKHYKNSKIYIYSRDEMKQYYMKEKYKNSNIRFLIGDIRDKDRLSFALNNSIDLIIHAAAMKIVPIAEYMPAECIKTNTIGAINLTELAIERKIPNVIALSTDKASNPINLYGASKLASDKIFLSSNLFSKFTKFSVVRYGNIINSRGSLFYNIKDLKKFNLTHPDMTRFFLYLDEAINLINFAYKYMQGGELFVLKSHSFLIGQIIKCFNKDLKILKGEIRPGEKLNEQMISHDDWPNVYELNKKIYAIISKDFISRQNKKLISIKEPFSYNSKENDLFISHLKKIQQFLKPLHDTLRKT
ncbi:polysaccharide biosynthesis protein [Candidatus Pelagibacter bacterium]|nr:SDR family NAD(P)-dependent oxidoreductase [Candidatus Pelagibacter bacterium]MDB2709333.1 polysaccharide biosynthesis protein [Candidatus Pelagibacter bacterium]